MPKKWKKQRREAAGPLTSSGIPLSEIERQEKELREAEEAERQAIKQMVKVKVKCFNGAIMEEYFYVMDVNYYCKTLTDYLVGEITVLRFNIQNGIKDYYHEIINPGHIPLGYTYDVKLGSKEIGLDMPDEVKKDRKECYQVLANIANYLKENETNAKEMPPLYTMPDRVAPVQNFILQLCAKTGEDDSLFRIYKLDTLFFTLINGIKTRGDEGFPRESLALAQLKKDPFQYTPKLGCEHHESNDKSVECTTSRTKRWAFTVLDSCCPVAGADMLPGTHMPRGYDLDSILVFKEQKKVRARPSVAASQLGAASSNTSASDFNQSSFYESACDFNQSSFNQSSFNQSSFNQSSFNESSFNESSFNESADSKKEKKKRTHTPLRMPKEDWRPLVGSFNKMNISKDSK